MVAGISITSNEFDLLRKYIEQHCGISLGNGKEYLVESRLANLVTETGSKSFSEFYRKVVNDPQNALRDKIVDAMTTNETFWFRDKTPFVILEEAVLPPLLDRMKAGQKQKLRIWSAASSTGQEAYSIAMIINELLEKRKDPLQLRQFEIVGTDISPSALFLAIAGRYDRISMSRGLDNYYKTKYFKQNGKVWVIDDNIKEMATFKRLNLQNSFAALGTFDIIFCRNVAIYFSDEFKRDLFRRLAQATNPGGALFIGSAETLSGYSTEFAIEHHKNGIYYKLKR